MTPEQIQEINRHISDALDRWKCIMLYADTHKWAYRLNYTQDDLMNALYIFNHVAQNIGIKNGTLHLLNVESVGTQLRQLVVKMTGSDPSKILTRNDHETN